MAIDRKLLEPGERVVHSTRTSWTQPLRASRPGSLLCLVGVLTVVLGPLLEAAAAILTGRDALTGHPLLAAAPVLGMLMLGLGSMFLVQSFTDWWLQGCFVTNLRVLTVDQSASLRGVTSPGDSRPVASRARPVLTTSIWLDSVTDVRMEQSLAGIWFRFGSVHVEQGSSVVTLPQMHHPAELCDAITTQRAPTQ